MKKNDPTLPAWDTLIIRLQRLRNSRCKNAPTVRDRSKRVRKISLPHECISNRKLRAHPPVQIVLRTRRNEPNKGISTTEVPYCFQKPKQILNLSFTCNGIFPSVHFQDQPKVTLSFKTEQYCTDLEATIPYAIDQKHTLGTHLVSQASFQLIFL